MHFIYFIVYTYSIVILYYYISKHFAIKEVITRNLHLLPVQVFNVNLSDHFEECLWFACSTFYLKCVMRCGTCRSGPVLDLGSPCLGLGHDLVSVLVIETATLVLLHIFGTDTCYWTD